jgi:hypothetical protein
LKAAQLNAGRIEGADMTRTDRDELQAAREAVGDVPLLAAIAEWRKARELTAGNLLPAAEAWAGPQRHVPTSKFRSTRPFNASPSRRREQGSTLKASYKIRSFPRWS